MSVKTTHSVPIPASALERVSSLGWNPVCHITYNRDAWVKLIHPLSEYAFDEAKLLCQESPNTWIVWVPDHGEIVLDISHFYC